MLEARDADLTNTCDGNDCPCARLKYAIESGNEEGLFAIDGSSGLVSAASDLADYDGQALKLYVSVVNHGPGGRAGEDVRGPKSYGSLTVIIGQQSAVSATDHVDVDAIHIRHKRASVLVALYLLISLSFTNETNKKYMPVPPVMSIEYLQKTSTL